jgi:serine O-acetyltransferase
VVYRLDITLRSLQEQIRRELEFSTNGKESGHVGQEQRAHEIASETGARLPKVRTPLDSDISAAYEGDPAAKSLDEVVFCFPGINAIIRQRLAHELYLLGNPMLARIIPEIAHAETGIDIHPGAEIGESFFIDHGTGVVIGETSFIGHHVRPRQRRAEVFDEGGGS